MAVGLGSVQAAGPPALFPFVLPWDDAAPGATDLSGGLSKPAGKAGRVRVGGGHLYVGSRRMRFFGVNLCFEGDLPRKQDAGKIAARMAKFGINVVRFHHMDMFPFPQGIRARGGQGTADLDAEALDRLDYLIARLQEHGIYANLNLLVSRPFDRGDGLPAEIERLDWKDRHVVGFFDQCAVRTQQQYARNLLTHRNPYTDRTYAEDPGVAFVEINNENGLFHAWLSGQVDRLPEGFRNDLRRRWNDWLEQRYGTAEKLRKAWAVGEEPLGKEMLTNGDFTQGMAFWTLERHDGAQATAAVVDDLPAGVRGGKAVQLKVARPGGEAWHVQLIQRGFGVRKGRSYTLSFWARADRPLYLSAGVMQARDPWQGLGSQVDPAASKEWKPFRLVFVAGATDEDARLTIGGLGRQTATVWLAGVSLRPGGVSGLGETERLSDGTVELLPQSHKAERTAERHRDWLRFLWDTEDAYWQAMSRFLKKALDVRAVIVGTIVGCSTPNLMARLDAVDTHAYWQHPEFPGRAWDGEDWRVANRTMVNEVGGTIPGLALRRVLGKPHCVSEYNHPAPNTYGSEGFLLLAAYAALQDWDAIYAFSYCHRGDWDVRRIPGFFDIDQHPTRMVTLPAAVAMFVRGDVRSGREQVVRPLSREQEIDALRSGHAWELVHGGHVGLPRGEALRHRVAVSVEGGEAGASTADAADPSTDRRFAADTGELLWDLGTAQRGVVTVNTARSKAVIGFGGGKRFELGGVIIEPGDTAQAGWSAITLTVMEGQDFKGPARLLVTATGTAENTDMRWKSPARDSVGRNWGRAPSLVEGIPARLTLPVEAEKVRCWALDECGQRGKAVTVRAADGKPVLDIGPAYRTLWYEIELK
jgi:hypothetical protein